MDDTTNKYGLSFVPALWVILISALFFSGLFIIALDTKGLGQVLSNMGSFAGGFFAIVAAIIATKIYFYTKRQDESKLSHNEKLRLMVVLKNKVNELLTDDVMLMASNYHLAFGSFDGDGSYLWNENEWPKVIEEVRGISKQIELTVEELIELKLKLEVMGAIDKEGQAELTNLIKIFGTFRYLNSVVIKMASKNKEKRKRITYVNSYLLKTEFYNLFVKDKFDGHDFIEEHTVEVKKLVDNSVNLIRASIGWELDK
ncbi:hypothetical protein [Pseudoalteromonas sp. T1lg88]|uniref:hypothetical protein n=1 Tax=Pseudoalteromonas sp. T1lg88 TaxID=2077104 RepID=UPI001319C6E9|nr:hypothetical protein [Pseudoalteromonas sp. T1lg88]